MPEGYSLDYASSDVVLNRIGVTNGRFTTTTGMSYRVLVVDDNAVHMPLNVLKKIRDLVNAGAIVIGPKPTDSPSNSDNQAEFKTIADQLWGFGEGAQGRKGPGIRWPVRSRRSQGFADLSGFRVYETSKRHVRGFRPSQDFRWRYLLRVQPQEPRGERGSHFPVGRQGAGTLACRDRRDRAGVLQGRQWTHYRFFEARSG